MTVCMPRLAYAGILTGMPRLLNIERENKVHEIDVQHVCRYVPRVVYAGLIAGMPRMSVCPSRCVCW